MPQRARREAAFDRAVTYGLGAMIALLTIVLYLATLPPAWVSRVMGW
jgi:hypothetical protein